MTKLLSYGKEKDLFREFHVLHALIGQMRQSPPKGECTHWGSFDEVAEVEDLRSKRQLVPGYTAEGYFLFTRHAVAASTVRKYAGEGAVRFVTLDEMYAHR